MNDTRVLRYAELTINPCSRVYGTAPCTAAVGVTGDFKCYNSPRTCQDPANYLAGSDQILRWAMPTSDLPLEIPAQPCIKSISRRPLVIDPGEGLGVRESVTVSMHNFRSNDSEFDNYPADRTGNPYNKGTYWGKFNARWGSLEGYEFKTVDGYVGQDLVDMVTRYYVVDSTTGPDSAGNFSFTAKDVMKFMDGDKAQFPLPSLGSLLSAITDTATTLTLTPAGIGNSDYPTVGFASIGDENLQFTRAADVVNLIARGFSGSGADSHEAGETFQLAVEYDAKDPAFIINDLLTTATTIPAAYIDFATWTAEVDAYLGRLYSAKIMKPTPVKMLIEELCREAGLTFFVDIPEKNIVLKVLRQEVPVRTIDDDSILAGKIQQRELKEKRVSELWIYYGKRNPSEKQGEQKNYSAIHAALGTDPVVALENNPPAIRVITSRWITTDNFPAVESISDRILARYQTTPRQIPFTVRNTPAVNVGDMITLTSRIFEDSQGDVGPPINCQVISLSEANGLYSIVSEEVNFGAVEPPVPGLRIININIDTRNINLRSLHDSIYSPAVSGNTVRLVVSTGVNIGSTNTSTAALEIGSWPAGVIIEIDGDGKIQGAGGVGGSPSDSSAGGAGGKALLTTYAVDIIGTFDIWGGGGGGGYTTLGGGLNGGGGSGDVPGVTGGTETAGGDPYPGASGAGGDPGDPGVTVVSAGGAAGSAIDGASFVTISGTANILGPQVN